jgi:hypothetical protein
LTLVVRTTLFVGVIEDVEVVVIDIVADKGVADELQDCGLADTSLLTRMIVYGARTLCFDVLMIPCLRDPTSLEIRSELIR